MEREIEVYKEFCTGCGLCHSVLNVEMQKNDKGFKYPCLRESDAIWCRNVCPAGGYALKKYADGSIWGGYKSSWLGWSINNDIRFRASTGGIITTLCIYLIDKKIVDGIIHVSKDPLDPTKTVNVVSKSREEILKCMGSRYTTSSPLYDIKQNVVEGEKYAFVGKPCDASALRMYKDRDIEKWTEQIIYIFSFFCAGQPSEEANNRLIKLLGIDNKKDCVDLQYRGNGWPGKTKAWKTDGTFKQMEYETSWMNILGRDVRKSCRFCADGTGEMADISCGDAWYLTEENRPDIFTERPGQNVIFARTNIGQKILDCAIKDGYIIANSFNPDTDLLHKRQPYHYARKASLSSLKLAMKICHRRFPLYENKKLCMFAKGFSLKQKILRCVGTIQRIMTKKI